MKEVGNIKRNVLHRILQNLLWIALHGTLAVSDVGNGCTMAMKLMVGLNFSAAGFFGRRLKKNCKKDVWCYTTNGNIIATFDSCHHYLQLVDHGKPEFYVFDRILLNGFPARGQCNTRGILATLTPHPPAHAPPSSL